MGHGRLAEAMRRRGPTYLNAVRRDLRGHVSHVRRLLPVEGSQLEPVQNFAFWKSLFRVSFSVAPVLSEGPLLVTVIV